jgi:hypothetical protein
MGGSSYWIAGELEGSYKSISSRKTIYPSLFSSAFHGRVEFDIHNRLEQYFPAQSKTLTFMVPCIMTQFLQNEQQYATV